MEDFNKKTKSELALLLVKNHDMRFVKPTKAISVSHFIEPISEWFLKNANLNGYFNCTTQREAFSQQLTMAYTKKQMIALLLNEDEVLRSVEVGAFDFNSVTLESCKQDETWFNF